MPGSDMPTYGDFPILFAGFSPDDPVDLDDARVWVAVFVRGDDRARQQLYPQGWRGAEKDQEKQSAAESWALVERLGLGDGTSGV